MKPNRMESLVNPIMQKIYTAAGGTPGGAPGGMPGGFPGGGFPGGGFSGDGAPNFEEVD